MKIVHISCYDGRGGAAIVCRRLIDTLRDNNIDASMLVMESQTSEAFVTSTSKTWCKRKMNFLRLAVEKFVFLFHEKSAEIRFQFSLANTGEDISKRLEVKDADIIHLHWINHGFLSLKGLNKIFSLGKPVVWTLHDMWAFTGGCHHSGDCENYQQSCGLCPYLKHPTDNDLSHTIWKRKKHILENKKIHVVGCSQWLANRAKDSSLFGKMPVTTIPNPIDTTVFKTKDKQILRREMQLSSDKKYILFGAENIKNYYKGISFFIEALTILKNSSGNEIEILLFGKKTEEVISLIPFKTNDYGCVKEENLMAQLYAAADVYVTSSIQENLPTTIMESMACGTPVAAFSVGGIPEMIDHKINGYLAKYKSADDLANGISWCLNEADTNELSQSARAKVMREYDKKVVAEKYTELYQEIK